MTFPPPGTNSPHTTTPRLSPLWSPRLFSQPTTACALSSRENIPVAPARTPGDQKFQEPIVVGHYNMAYKGTTFPTSPTTLPREGFWCRRWLTRIVASQLNRIKRDSIWKLTFGWVVGFTGWDLSLPHEVELVGTSNECGALSF